tara:strand:- start:9023 stop:9256 length:234 start_codon:yes stop_codon:yes gene_type:complete
MESRKNKEKKVNSLSDADKEQIQVIIDRLTDIKSDESSIITEDSVRVLEYTVIDTLNLYTKHQKLLTRWVKQGYLLD